jgi:triosephosphate isomerase (TIM)
MAARKKLIVGNWKMNLNIHEASLFVHKLALSIETHRDVEVVLAPTTLALQSVSLQIDRRQFKLAAQNFYFRDSGAFTGEVSATQLRGLVEYGIVGHSERRHIFHEHDKDIRDKVQAAIRNDINPILCIGETAHERSENETTAVLHDQLTGGLANVTSEDLAHVVIAYEPVWAISSGTDYTHHKTPTPDEIKKVMRVIRRHISHLYGDHAAAAIRILYGGSVNPDNAGAYLQTEGVDGLLVGGASINQPAFTSIVELVHQAVEMEK